MNLSPAIICHYNEAHVAAIWRHDSDENVAKIAAQVLDAKYPGYLWGVHAQVREGLLDILNMNLSGSKAFTVKLEGLFTYDSLRDAVMRAGGDLLDRAGMPRGRFDADRYANLKLDLRGLPILAEG